MSYGINPTFNSNFEEFERLAKIVIELQKKVNNMSAAMWCDPGKHAFSSNDEGMETLSRTKVVQDDKYGGKHEVTYQVHICGEHIVKLDPFGEHADENKTQALEAWNEGFEAGRATAE